ncbi:MAG: patatin-like phospholipase family protein, partial [Pseudomonadota bacterium]|nr:patatin-like phospholipase family protein [Pseudomonadota bacterium]
MGIKEKLSRPGPKRLLALDGGGIRGMISIEVLASIEALLKRRMNRGDDFVLADYFDYIAGTSTGGIIATCLAWGMKVAAVREFYRDNGKTMFDKASILRRFLYKYDDTALAEKLREVFSENGKPSVLGSARLRTLLMLVMRNSTT